MARKYPRFVYSNPSNTKSKGPFIIHTLSPVVLCKVLDRRDPSYDATDHLSALHFGDFAIEILEHFDGKNEDKVNDIMVEMNRWLRSQIVGGEIDPPFK